MADIDSMAEPDEQTEVGHRRAKWRTPVAALLVVALLVLAGGLVVRYRHDHRDEWYHAAHAWHHVETGDEGRTLTFVGYPGGACEESDGVTFDSDPTAGGTVMATLHMKHQTVRDGQDVACSADLVRVPDTVVTFGRPVPAGTVFLDPTAPGPPFDCGPTRQVIGEPTMPVNSSDCGP